MTTLLANTWRNHFWLCAGAECFGLQNGSFSPCFAAPWAAPLNSFPVECHRRAGSIDLERSVRSDGIRSDENPVLPGREAPEDSRFQCFVRAEAQIGLQTGERVGRKRGARFDGLAQFVFPIKIVGC